MLSRTRAALAAAAVTVIVVGASVDAVAADKNVTSLRALSAQIAAAINTARAQHGLAPLRVSRRLHAAAVLHSDDMATHGFFSHDSSNGTSLAARLSRLYPPSGYRRRNVGETLLWYSPEIDAATTVADWLASPEHRVILLDGTFREIGVSAVHVAPAPKAFIGDEATLVTADFGARLP